MSGEEAKLKEKYVQEGSSAWWDQQRQIVQDYSNDGFDYQRVQADNGGDAPSQSNITYRLQTQGNRYLVPSESYLEMDFNVKKADGATELEIIDKVVYDGGSQFYFSEVSYFIGEREVERKNYADVAEIVKKLIKSPYTKQNKSNFRIETGNALNTYNADTIDITKAAYNKAVHKKVKMDNSIVKNKATHRIRIPLKEMFELHEEYPIAWHGQEHQLRIQLKSKNAGDIFFRGAAPATNCAVILNKLVLWSATVRPSSNMEQKLLSTRGQNSKQLMIWDATNVYQKIFDKGQTINWRITDASTRVQKVVIMARNQDDVQSQSKNSHVVSSNRLPKSGLHLLYNGNKIPQIDLDSNGGSYIRLYHEYLRCAGYSLNSMDNAPLTYDEFVNAYCLVCFDLSQLSEDIQSFGSLATLDFSGSFEDTGDGKLNLTAVVFQERVMTVSNGSDAQYVSNVRGFA